MKLKHDTGLQKIMVQKCDDSYRFEFQFWPRIYILSYNEN